MFFSKKGIPARTIFIIYSNKICDVNHLVFGERRYISVRRCCIPARLTLAVPTSAQWKGSEKSGTQTRPRNATRHVSWYLFLTVMKVTRIEMAEIDTKHHKRTHTSLTFRLPYLRRFITWKLTHFIPQRIHLYQPALVESYSPVKIQIPYPATFPLRFSPPKLAKSRIPPNMLWTLT